MRDQIQIYSFSSKINARKWQYFNNFYIRQLFMKQAKWTIQEENKLKQLKEEQSQKNEISWEIISKKLNEFFSTNKTSKQCRERYVNYLKFGTNESLNLEWKDQEIDLVMNLYHEHGSAWSTISSKFKNKSENSIKNKFNNCLRKCAKILQETEISSSMSTKKSITNQLLTIMLDMSNKVKKMVSEGTWRINEDCMIFRFRASILHLAFRPEKFSYDETVDLLRLIKSINSKLRCFGVFKVKSRKHWKLTEKCLESLCQFDQIIREEQPQSEPSIEMMDKQSEKGSLGLSPMHTKLFQDESQFLQLPCIQQYKATQKRITLDQELFDIIGYEEPLSSDDNLIELGF